MLLEQTESERSLGGGARLGNVDHAETLIFEILGEFGKIVLTDVVARKNNGGIFLVGHEPRERISQGLDDGTRSEVASADAGYDHDVTLGTQGVGYGLHLIKELGCDGAGQMQPTQEVVARTGSAF